jgi:hypothetical protein
MIIWGLVWKSKKVRPNEGFLQILLCEQQLLGEFKE